MKPVVDKNMPYKYAIPKYFANTKYSLLSYKNKIFCGNVETLLK